jgi:hypothetical protein
LMEMVERYSSFASFSSELAIGYKNELNLVRSSYTDLVKQGLSVEVFHAGSRRSHSSPSPEQVPGKRSLCPVPGSDS